MWCSETDLESVNLFFSLMLTPSKQVFIITNSNHADLKKKWINKALSQGEDSIYSV